MSLNPDNKPGCNVVLVGNAAGEAETRAFGNGNEVVELRVAVSKGYMDKNTDTWVDTGTDWYTYSATPDFAAKNWPDVQRGDRVRIENARLEARPFVRKDGEAGVDLQIRFGDLSIIQSRADRSNPSSGWGGGSEDRPF